MLDIDMLINTWNMHIEVKCVGWTVSRIDMTVLKEKVPFIYLYGFVLQPLRRLTPFVVSYKTCVAQGFLEEGFCNCAPPLQQASWACFYLSFSLFSLRYAININMEIFHLLSVVWVSWVNSQCGRLGKMHSYPYSTRSASAWWGMSSPCKWEASEGAVDFLRS